jgi:hypothetical protein
MFDAGRLFLHKLGLGCGEAILRPERLTCPSCGEINRCDVPSSVSSFSRSVADLSGSRMRRGSPFMPMRCPFGNEVAAFDKREATRP